MEVLPSKAAKLFADTPYCVNRHVDIGNPIFQIGRPSFECPRLSFGHFPGGAVAMIACAIRLWLSQHSRQKKS
jgi:hypothetical protein